MIETYQAGTWIFACVLARVGGLAATLPNLGGTTLPVRVRIVAALLIAAAISSAQWRAVDSTSNGAVSRASAASESASRDSASTPPTENRVFLIAIAGELAVGLAFGLATALVISAASFAGQTAASLSGMSLASSLGDNGEPLPALARLYQLAAVGIFLTLGGHRQVLSGLLDSFSWLPPGEARLSSDWLNGLVALAGASMEMSLQIAAPILAALLLAHLAVAFVSRTVPQLTSIGVGFGLNGLAALAVVTLSLGTLGWLFEARIESSIDLIRGHVVQSADVPVGWNTRTMQEPAHGR